MPNPIALDVPTTWPQLLREAAERAAEHPSCQGDYPLELTPAPEISEPIDEILAEHGIVAYHYARLLDHEIDGIRRDGLRPTSDALLARKLDAAVAGGFLTRAQAQHLIETGALTDAAQRSARINEICAVTTRADLDYNGLTPLLRSWGGEITYFWQANGTDPELTRLLTTLGRPQIVSFRYFPSVSDFCTSNPANAVIGNWRGSTDSSIEIHHRPVDGRPVPVLDISEPDPATSGHPQGW